jgi:hypothetical protein
MEHAMKRSTIVLLFAALLALASAGCHEDLSWSQRFYGIGADEVIQNLESEDPDAVRDALVWLSYAEFDEGSEAARESQRKIMRFYTMSVRGEAFNPEVPADLLIRCTAARCIARCESFVTPEAIEALTTAMSEDDEPMVRVDCAKSLGQLARPGLAEPLVRTLHTDPSPDVRMAAARALSHFRPGEGDDAGAGPTREDYRIAVTGLLQRLDDRTCGVRRVSCESLATLTDNDDIACTPEAWRKWGEGFE